MVLKGFFANINMKLNKNLEFMDIGTELSIKSNPLFYQIYGLHVVKLAVSVVLAGGIVKIKCTEWTKIYDIICII